jgi:hypothetical protein
LGSALQLELGNFVYSGSMSDRRSALILSLALLACPCRGADTAAPAIPAFSSQRADAQAPRGWSPVTFRKSPRHTQYSLVTDAGTLVIRARAEASASALTHRLNGDAKQFPILRWRWKIEHLLTKSDIARKQGDDYLARIYVTFDIDPHRASIGERIRFRAGQLIFGKDLPYAGLCYVWDTHAPVGTVVPNAYTDNVRMIVVESGGAHIGRWIDERRNVVEDYRIAFGSDPPPLSGIAIMTDTDDTGEAVTA